MLKWREERELCQWKRKALLLVTERVKRCGMVRLWVEVDGGGALGVALDGKGRGLEMIGTSKGGASYLDCEIMEGVVSIRRIEGSEC